MGLPEVISNIQRRLNVLERRANQRSRTGTIKEVDASRGLARVELQEGLVTGWLPWGEMAAGANKTHNPPSEGQQVTVSSESGRLEDGIILMSINSNKNARPSSAGDEFILSSVGAAKIAVLNGGSEIYIAVGGVSLSISSSGIAITGGQLTHNGKNIGDTHVHNGVQSGPAKTQPPS